MTEPRTAAGRALLADLTMREALHANAIGCHGRCRAFTDGGGWVNLCKGPDDHAQQAATLRAVLQSHDEATP